MYSLTLSASVSFTDEFFFVDGFFNPSSGAAMLLVVFDVSSSWFFSRTVYKSGMLL